MSGEPGYPYPDHDVEMIACTLIRKNHQSRFTGDVSFAEKEGPFNSHYVSARTKVYHILFKIFGSELGWVHAKGSRKSMNGRAVWFALRNFYPGKDHVNRIALSLIKPSYDCPIMARRRSGSSDTSHKEVHVKIDALVEHGIHS